MSQARKIRRNLATREANRVQRAYEGHRLRPLERDIALVGLRTPPRGLRLAARGLIYTRLADQAKADGVPGGRVRRIGAWLRGLANGRA
jgi:hypothetical protein